MTLMSNEVEKKLKAAAEEGKVTVDEEETGLVSAQMIVCNIL